MKTIIVDFLRAWVEIMLKTDQVFFLNTFSSIWDLTKRRKNMQLANYSEGSWLPPWAVFVSDKKNGKNKGQ